MEWMILLGAVVSLVGLAGLILSAMRIIRARRAGLDDDALRAKLQSVLPLNMAALLLSVLGLMMVVVGVLLG